MTEQSIPWCCTGRGYVSECPLCPQYGTSLLDPCPGHPDTDTNRQAITSARLHAERRHPDYEYATTTGPRKQWDTADQPPYGDDGEPEPGWEANVDAGRPGQGWDRFDYTEEAYWRRRKPVLLDATALTGQLAVASSAVQAVQIAQPPIITVMGSNGRPLITVHPDGRLEYGEGYEPDEAARRFWDGVEQAARTIQYGAPLNATINEHLAAGEDAERRLKAVTEAVTLWRDRPGGDVGLAIALAGILDTPQPEPPASAALVRVLRECDRLERAVRATPQGSDFDGAYPAAIKRIREAAGPVPDGTDPRQAAYDAVFAYIHSQPRDFLPTTVVNRNAMIWHAVHAALDAVGVPQTEQPKED